MKKEQLNHPKQSQNLISTNIDEGDADELIVSELESIFLSFRSTLNKCEISACKIQGQLSQIYDPDEYGDADKDDEPKTIQPGDFVGKMKTLWDQFQKLSYNLDYINNHLNKIV